MIQKLGAVLLALMVAFSAWLLVRTQQRAAAIHAPETTAPTVDHSLLEETRPEEAPTVQAETESPVLTELSPSAQRVREKLDLNAMTETVSARYVYVPELNAVDSTVGAAKNGYGQGLAELGAVLRVNPIAAFWQIVSAGVYEKTPDQSGVLASASLPAPQQAAKSYTYTQEGVRQLLTDLLTLAGQMGDGLDLEAALGAVMDSDVHASDREGCYYAYFTCGGDRSSHILCFYLRPDKSGKQIADVEFQLLNLTAAIGNPEILASLDRRGTNQAASLMAAAELLMTGESRAAEGKIPFTYGFGGCHATIQRFAFQSDGEWGELINYRVKK